MPRPTLSFAAILPIAALLTLVPMLVFPTAYEYLNLLALTGKTGHARIALGQNGDYITIPRDRLLSFAFEGTAMRASRSITAANMPGVLGEALVSMPTSWPSSWHPANLNLEVWRSISLPFLCLPFWWLAGRGLDGLRGRHLSWGWLLPATLLGIFMLIMASVAASGFEDQATDDKAWMLTGSLFWGMMLAGVMPTVWIRQWKARRALQPQQS